MAKKLCVLLILLIFPHIFGENFTNNENETLETDETKFANEMADTKRLCNQTDSCESLCTNLERQDDRKTKICLCHTQCSTFEECCVKVQLKNDDESRRRRQDEKSACVRTSYNTYVRTIHKCPGDYAIVDSVRKCETTDRAEMLRNPLLLIPVINQFTNVTYKNVFCATCHNESQFQFWNAIASCTLKNEKNAKIIPEMFSLDNLNSTIDSQLLLNLKVDENGGNFISKFGVLSYVCEIRVKLPDNLNHFVRHCRPDSVHTTHSEIFTSPIRRNYSALSPRTFQIQMNDSFFSHNRCDRVSSVGDDVEYCFFKNLNGQRCLINRFLIDGDDFHFVDNETIFANSYKATFGAEEWIADTSNGSRIFLCGTEIPRSNKQKFYFRMNAIITGVLIKCSIVSLAAHLILSANVKKLQSLPNKIMYSYSFILFVIYVLWEMQSWLSSCQLAAIIMHYLCLSCFVWLLIASYDCWLVLCHSSQKFLTIAGKTRVKRFLYYSFWGWISPFSVLAMAMYFEFAPNSSISCSLKPGYGRLNKCFLAQEAPFNYFYRYPTALVSCVNISLFLHTSYRIFTSKRKGITSTLQNNSYVIFIKLSLNMGIVVMLVLVWTMYILVTNVDFVVLHTLKHIVDASQGVFIFFAFSFDKTMILKSTDS